MLKQDIMGRLFYIVALNLISYFSFTQGTEIILNNPSFEDVPHQGVSIHDSGIRGWYDCGALQFPSESPPDIHPVQQKNYPTNSYWNVKKNAQEGETYLGLIVRDNDSWESVSQRLTSTLSSGSCYEISLYMARSIKYISGSKEQKEKYNSDKLVNYNVPTILRIFAGTGVCGKEEILAESIPIENSEWEKFTFKLEPTRDYNYFTLEAFYEWPIWFPYNGHILIDNISSIKKIPCNDPIAAAKPEPKKAQRKQRKKTPPPRKNKTQPVFGQSSDPITFLPSNKPKSQKISGLGYKEISKGQIITIKNLYFKMDKATVLEKSFKELNNIFNFLKNNNGVVVEIGGHTNTVPPKDYCIKLSKQRAKAVTDYLVEQGIPEFRIKYRGYGKSKPIIENDKYDLVARQKNQRVEIKILELGD